MSIPRRSSTRTVAVRRARVLIASSAVVAVVAGGTGVVLLGHPRSAPVAAAPAATAAPVVATVAGSSRPEIEMSSAAVAGDVQPADWRTIVPAAAKAAAVAQVDARRPGEVVTVVTVVDVNGPPPSRPRPWTPATPAPPSPPRRRIRTWSASAWTQE